MKYFFATLILYESKSRIREASLDTCRPLGTGDPGEMSPGDVQHKNDTILLLLLTAFCAYIFVNVTKISLVPYEFRNVLVLFGC
jgi:hypothetical protein